MDGVLLIDKPAGWTSFDVVAKIRGQLRRETGNKKIKVGHAGTLDPFATGLLIVLTGEATKRQNEFMKQDKVYEATLKLGFKSTTGDPEGKITSVNAQKPSLETLEAVLAGFVGEIEQIPPQFSAIKVDGQRAYKLARQGKAVKLEPRKVTIYELKLVSYDYPEVKIVTKVSSGTYIRSLAEDIGQKLGTKAYLTALRRTQIGLFGVKDAGLSSMLTKKSHNGIIEK